MSNALEDVIDEVDGFGPYQIRVWVLVSLFETPAAWAMFFPVFANLMPTWTCYNNISDIDNGFAFQNEYHNVSGSNHNRSSGLLGMSNVSGIGNVTLDDGSVCMDDGGICPGIRYTSYDTSIRREWGLLCDRDYIPMLITTIQMVGLTIGAVSTGQMADVFGRRRVLFLQYFLMSVFGFLSSFSPNWQSYALGRFLIGFSLGGVMVVNFVLPMEFITKRWRTLCGCIGAWAVGVCVMAPVAYLLPYWRHLSIAISLGGLPLMFTWWWVPESPRWLLMKGRCEEASKIITDMAHTNNKPLPDLNRLKHIVKKHKEQEQEYNKYGFWDLFRTRQMTSNTLIIFYSWFVCSILYYGNSLNVGTLLGNVYLNVFLMGLVELPAIFIVLGINNVIGRKKTLIIFMSVAGLSCFSFLFLEIAGKLQELAPVATTLSLLGKCGTAGAWAVVQIFSAELYPTVVRNIGYGTSAMFARVGGILSPQIIYLNRLWEPTPYVVIGAAGLLCTILAYFLPETFKSPLQDDLPARTCCLRLQARDNVNEMATQDEREQLNCDVKVIHNGEVKDVDEVKVKSNGNGVMIAESGVS